MPPKKKVDPEALQQQFEQWKESAEYKKWEEMSEGLNKFQNVTETTLDINGPWQDYLDELMKFFQMMKAKTGKVKELKQEMIRSFFFAHEDKENDKIVIDGIQCGVPKEHADRSWTLRHKFCDILKAFTDIEELDFENFQTNKKNLQKTINEFFKYFNPHVKSGHKEIYEGKIFKVLEPLDNLIQINALYYSFNKKYKTESDKEIRSFKVKALTEKYSTAYDEVLRILDEESKDYKLFAKSDIKKTFYKLTYKNWANNPCEKLYLQPLHDNFIALQKVLMDMYAYNINFWKIPLSHNEEFVGELVNLIKAELISDRLIGTPLRRELFNFVYKVSQIIKDSHPFLENNMLKKDENTINGSIPKLVVFKIVQHMYQWKLNKAESERQYEEKIQRLQQLGKMKGENKNQQQQSKNVQTTIPDDNNFTSNNDNIINNSSNNNNNGTIVNNTTIHNASFLNATNIGNDGNISVNLSNSFVGKDKLLDEMTPRKLNDTSMMNASIVTSASYSNANNHTSTKSKLTKVMSSTLPVKISIKSPTNKQELFNFADQIEDKIEDPVAEQDLLQYGRYFYLDGFISEDKLSVFETCVELIKDINPAVQQDIEDYIIIQGMTPKVKDRHDQSRVQARLQLEKMQENDFSNAAVNSTRPPELWNYPTAVQKHTFRSIAKPKDCYVDGRFEEFDEKLDILTQNLISTKPQSWREIVSRVIDVFADNYNKEITPIDPNEIL